MKVLAVLQLILAAVQVVIWFLYRRDVKRRERASQSTLEAMARELHYDPPAKRQPARMVGRKMVPPEPFRLAGCTCPPPYPRNWHFGSCQWGN